MKVIQYVLSGICITFALSVYLLFLAQRDSKLFQNYASTTIQQRVRE
jgi:hypothetical protein